MEQFLQLGQGLAAKQRFVEMATLLKAYEEELFTQWLSTATNSLPIYLKQSLLLDAEQRPDLFRDEVGQGDHDDTEWICASPSYRLPLFVCGQKIADRSITAGSLARKLQLSKEQCHLFQYRWDPDGRKNQIEIRYLIPSHTELKQCLIECSHLERLGFHLPESIVQTTFQYEKFEHLSEQLRSMLEDYHLTMASLDTIEISLLQSHLEELQRAIQPGTSRISLGDIGNLDYVEQCQKQLEQLHSILNQIRKICADIREHLETVRFCTIDPLVPRTNDGQACLLLDERMFRLPRLGSLFACRAYFEFLDGKRQEIASSLKRRYELMGPLLTKVEALVFGSNTGKHPKSNERDFIVAQHYF